MAASLLVEYAVRPAPAVSGLGKARVRARTSGDFQAGPGTMPMLCLKSPKWVSLAVITIRAGVTKRSWSRRTNRWLASTLTAKVDSKPSGPSVSAFVY